MNRNRKFLISLFVGLCISFLFSTNLWADYFDGNIQITYKSDIIDLRPEYNLNRSSGGTDTTSYTSADLKVGSIFIAPNGAAKEVTDIYVSNGQTVIETTVPDYSDVFDYLEIPDFEINVDTEDFTDLGEGVTLLSDEESMDTDNYLSSDFEDGTRLSGSSSSSVGKTFNINKVLYSKSSDATLVKNLDKKIPSGSEYSVSNSVEVRLKGTVKVGISASGYYKINWRCQTWGKAKITVTQEVDVKVIGTAILNEEYSIYIGSYSSGIFTGKLYANVSVTGQVSLSVRLYESSTITAGAEKNKKKYSTIWSPTYNIGFQPEAAATATIKAGPMVTGQIGLCKLTLSKATLKTGLGLTLNGFIGAENLIGRTQNGKYGDISKWIVDAKARLFIYMNAKVKILKKSFNIYDNTWTLKTWSN